MIGNYRAVSKQHLHLLIDEVNGLLAEGWTPAGGLVFSRPFPGNVDYYIQMMYRPAGPEPSDGRRCENCRHWSPIEDDPHSEGLCRRDPPAILDTGSADVPYLDTFYPQTSRGQCCGEWASTPPSPTPPEGEPTQ